MLGIQFAGQAYAGERVERSVERALESSTLCSIATVTPDGEPHISTVYFSWTARLEVFFLSDPGSNHSRNLAQNAALAVTVYDTAQGWDDDHLGLQLFGECVMTRGKERSAAETHYAERFPEYARWWSGLSQHEQSSFPSRYYVFRATRIKVLDEREFGEEVFVEAEIKRNTA